MGGEIRDSRFILKADSRMQIFPNTDGQETIISYHGSPKSIYQYFTTTLMFS